MSGAAPYIYPGCGHTQLLKRRKRQEHPIACGDCVHGRKVPPSIWQAANAANGVGVLPLLDQDRSRGHWAAGWLYWLTGCAMPCPEGMLASTANALAGWLENSLHDLPRTADTARVTRCLTYAAWDAADATPDAKSWRELRLPVITPGTKNYGRLDVVIWHPHRPDIVIEIDSTAKRGSIQKLEFARDAGACPIWVRHGSGSIDVPDGIAVIDLR